ncbi:MULTISPECIES: glycosyltransferase family 4 protein [Flavobacterium]|uniref:glycosyltransferase family 4 protein n=1 Tax=Flavobacterium TaxID=237 RepID=UPI001FCAFF30|nr:MULTISPECIES: glycosyltransferase family 4 protein [Flavobacterium]UOK43757.1 glycosyltransferase family 4 protein [Flavobacterium enshiense]
MKNVLFITWDGPQTSYMEGLFMPILSEVQKKADYKIHVIQFTWGTKERIAITQRKAQDLNITYTARPITRKPVATLGSLLTLYTGIKFLKKYIRSHKIDIVMPRSTMPSIMINRLKKTNFQVLFDADGLPLEERIDFSGLSRKSKQYRWLKNEETRLLKNSNGVLTRSEKSVEVHLNTIGKEFRSKFDVVFNGRDAAAFKPSEEDRKSVRALLGFSKEDIVFVYCGSLGPQYGWEEMMAIFKLYSESNNQSKLILLTGNTEFALQRLPESLRDKIIIQKVPIDEVPKFLNAADVAFAIRKPTFSMQGVAPIKLGEYLLMGLPVIASKGIGDTEQILERLNGCLLFDHQDTERISKAKDFVISLNRNNSNGLREVGQTFFSLDRSAESYLNAFNKL